MAKTKYAVQPKKANTGRDTSLAGKTVLSGGQYVTRDAEGYAVNSTRAGGNAAETVTDRLRSGTYSAGDDATRQIAAGTRNASDGFRRNAAYTMAAAQMDSGQTPDTTGLSAYQVQQLQQGRQAQESAAQASLAAAQGAGAAQGAAAQNAAAASAAQNTGAAQVESNPTRSQAYTMAKAYLDSGQSVPAVYANALTAEQAARLGLSGGAGAAQNTAQSAAAAASTAAQAQGAASAQGAAAAGTVPAAVQGAAVPKVPAVDTSQFQTPQSINLPEYNPAYVERADTSAFRDYLDQWLSTAQRQAENRADYATEQGVNELTRAREDAEEQYQRQRNQIDIDEARARENQALYAAARGDRGGIGAAQYDAVMAAAAQNRQTVNTARQQMANDTARQIADLRARGEYEKADAALQLSQQYLQQLMQLEQWGMEYNLGVDQFNAQLDQWAANYQLQAAQMNLGLSQWWDQFRYQIGRDAVADARYADETAYNRAWNEEERAYTRAWNEDDRAYNRAWNEDDRAYTRAWNEGEREYSRGRDAIADARYEDETAYNREQDRLNREFQIQQADRQYDMWREEFQAGRTDAEFSQWLARQNLSLSQNNQAFNQNLALRQIENAEQQQLWNQAQTAKSQLAGYGQMMLAAGIVPDEATLAAMGISQGDASLYASTVRAASGMSLPSTEAAQSILRTAAAEVGTRESAGNVNKYSKAAGHGGQPWCVDFVNYVFTQNGMGGLLPTTTSSTTSFAKAAKDKGEWVPATGGGYQVGDVLIYDYNTGDGKYDHMDIVTGVNEDGSLTVIGGNVSNKVTERRVSGSSLRRVAGAWRPNYGGGSATGSSAAGSFGDVDSIFEAAYTSGTPSAYLSKAAKAAGVTASALQKDYNAWAKDENNLITNGPKGGQIPFDFNPDEGGISVNGKTFSRAADALAYINSLTMSAQQYQSLIRRIAGSGLSIS